MEQRAQIVLDAVLRKRRVSATFLVYYLSGINYYYVPDRTCFRPDRVQQNAQAGELCQRAFCFLRRDGNTEVVEQAEQDVQTLLAEN